MWEVPRKDDKIMVEWGADFDNFDPVTQVRGLTCHCASLCAYSQYLHRPAPSCCSCSPAVAMDPWLHLCPF